MTEPATESENFVVSANDEYAISLEEGIEDESLLEDQQVRQFKITSYGADYTVDSLVKRMRGGAFKIPSFQRNFVWSQRHASRFIESLLMGLPIPSIFLYKESDTNHHLVIDGQQRLRTLQAFYDGTFGEKKFRLVGVMDPWNGKTYEDLDPSDQLKIDDSIVHAIIFRQDTPEDALDSIYYVFERINSGGIRLSPQEIRNCIAEGPFTQMVKEINLRESWRNLFGGPPNKRAKDEELIIRFFAMLRNGADYQKPMAKFLNDSASRYNKLSQRELAGMTDVFCSASDAIWEALGPAAFRPNRPLNAAVFDAVMPVVAKALLHRPISADEIRASYAALLADKEFVRVSERATSDEEAVRTRQKLAAEKFGV
ncbi:DUF262 domain-containing protein [Erythrobacter oryzae]|uniref:DUF262 domain-containing protein n=1 Tax=Erythrobacter oryzae TaxID=3019556 RepID=UPI00255620F5|nr:DUF262 domain-containing protein [Erythrobacter sp. COR-2]